MKKLLKILLPALCVVCVCALAACNSYSQSDKEYWFSKVSKNYIAYDDAANDGAGNLDEAGTVWEMTMARSCNVTINIVVDSKDMFSTTYFYVNGEQVKSEYDTGVYSFVYKDLSLKKGDKLKFHAFWTNSIIAAQSGMATMSVFAMQDAESNFIIDDIS